MPGLYFDPLDRRSFLKLSLLGGAAVVSASIFGPAHSAVSGEFRLALLSDTHVPADAKNEYRGFKPWENLQRIVPDVVAFRPEGVVINGDAARLEGLPGDYAELKALLEPVASQAPVYVGMGNHDERANFAKVFSPPPGEHPKLKDKLIFAIESEPVRVLVLDSLQYTNKTPGLLGKQQRAWLSSFLATHADRPTVIFVHHTLEDDDGDLLDAPRFFALLAPHRHVKAVFYGHSHEWEIQERAGLKLINLPAVGYNFNDKEPVGWVEAKFRSGGVELTLRAIGGNRTDHGRVFRVSWV